MNTVYLEEFLCSDQTKRIRLTVKSSSKMTLRIKLLRGCRWCHDLVAWTIPWEENYVSKLNKILGKKVDLVPFERLGSRIHTNSHTQEASQKTINEFIRSMLLKNYSDKTIRSYTDQIRILLEYFPAKTPQQITQIDITEYQYNRIMAKGKSVSTQNQFINAIKVFYQSIDNPNFHPDELVRPIRPERPPVILSRKEVEHILNTVENLKHKAVLSLIYSSGIRISEAVRMRLADIDPSHNLIHIRKKENTQGRQVPLSARLQFLLKNYCKKYKPKIYLFEGKPGKPYSIKSIQVAFSRTLKKTGITKPATVHSLRHSFALHLLENGTDIRHIRELLGHKTAGTSRIYTRAGTAPNRNIASPIDSLNI